MAEIHLQPQILLISRHPVTCCDGEGNLKNFIPLLTYRRPPNPSR